MSPKRKNAGDQRTADQRARPPRRKAAPAPAAEAEPEPLSAEATPVLVGIGASAGGLEALSRLLPHLAHDGVAYVIVQHLAPTQSDRFLQALAKHSQRPIVLVEPGMAPREGGIYLAPAHALVELADGRFLFAQRADPPRPLLPIDYFLYSLANGPDGPGIGVVLSGMGSDGIAGLREIKAAGGIAIAQDPATAEYDAMPRAAIEGGLADLVLPPEKIAAELPRLVEMLSLRGRRPRHAGDTLEVDEAGLAEVFAHLRADSGVDFSSYKPGTIRRRLQRRMALNRVDTLPRYVRLLAENPEEVKELYRDLLINVTRFFRDPSSFEALQKVAFPKLIEDRRLDDPLRIWVPGCSTGEEAYSVAIALLEFLGDRGSSYRIQIFATDLSESAVGVARAGVYPPSVAEQISPERIERFLTPTDGGFRMAKRVRDLCIFTRHDLTRDPPFSHLDLVMCRNVLIYLSASAHKRVLSILHYGLKADGFLVLGSAESVGPRADLFRAVDKRHSIYARKGGDQLPLSSFARDYGTGSVADRSRRAAMPRPVRDQVAVDADRQLLERFAPPAVIVDSSFDIVQARGQTGRFLELASGEANLNLLRMARPGLLHGVRVALNEARKTDKPARKQDLRIDEAGAQRVDVEVLPLGGAGESRHFLVLFQDAAPATAAQRDTEAAAGAPRTKRAAALQEELADTRQYLQAMIQDLEATNEELQSANEEILSSNEELQSTNEELETAREELQSTNEELQTVNEELHVRNEELARANSDLGNLLASMQMAIVMVDNDLRIRRFTPAAEKVLNLIPSDVGRRIGQIKPNIQCPELEDLIRTVTQDLRVVECEVRDAEGGWFQLRIRSYKGHDGRIDGAVLTLSDLKEVKQREREAREAQRLASEVIAAMEKPLALLGLDRRVRAANQAFAGALGLRVQAVVGQLIGDLAGDGWDGDFLEALLGKGRRSRRPITVTGELPGDSGRRLVARRLAGEDVEPVIVLSVESPGAPQLDGEAAAGER